MGLFDKLKQGLKKTATLLNTDFRDLFKTQGQLVDEAFLEQLFADLIKIDMGVQGGRGTVDEIGATYRARIVQWSDIIGTIKTKLKAILAQPCEPIRFASAGPTVIMVCGVNGCGKTTSIAKLAHLFKAEGKKVILGMPTRSAPGPSPS